MKVFPFQIKKFKLKNKVSKKEKVRRRAEEKKIPLNQSGEDFFASGKNLAEALVSAKSSKQAKSHFLAQMGHDIRTPLNAIIGFSTLIMQHPDDKEKVLDEAEKILFSGKHLLALINDILDMSKIESGKFHVNAQKFRLSAMLSMLDNMLRPQFEEKEQQFEIQLYGMAHDFFIADEMRLQQVLINLLSNALKYTDSGGFIRLGIRGRPAVSLNYENIEFEVQDNGRGMSEEYQKILFTPFAREKLSQYKETQGTGLGLAIAHNLVELMGGNISVKSRLGQGSTFTVIIPMKVCEDEPMLRSYDAFNEKKSTAEKDITSVLSGLKILAVEDNALNAEILLQILKLNGAEVSVAEDGKKALETFRDSKCGSFDVILMDIQMPVMNGYESTIAIRALKEDESLVYEKRCEAELIPIIAMTANAFNEDVQKALLSGMNAHVAKPLDLALLCRTIARLKGNGV